MKSFLVFLLITVLTLTVLVGCNAKEDISDMNEDKGDEVILENVSNKEAQTLIKEKSDLIILDVRTEEEYQSGHLKNAKLIPLDQLSSRLDELDQEAPILVYCRSGNRSATAAKILSDNDFKEVYNLQTGIKEWDGEIVTE